MARQAESAVTREQLHTAGIVEGLGEAVGMAVEILESMSRMDELCFQREMVQLIFKMDAEATRDYRRSPHFPGSKSFLSTFL